MEISNLTFTKYLSSDEKSLYYLEEFFKANNNCLELFIEYDKISYIDDYSKFFFLFSRREVFLDQFEDYLSEYVLHKSSVFYLLFFTHLKFSHTLKHFQ